MRQSFLHKKTYGIVLLHIIGSITFLFLPLVASPGATIFDGFQLGVPEKVSIVTSVLLIGFFYLNYFVFIPRFFHKRKYTRWLLLLMVSFAVIVIVPNLFFKEGIMPPKNTEMTFPPDFNGHNLPEKTESKDFPPDFDNHPMPPKMPHESSLGHFLREYQIQESLLKFLFVLAFSVLLKTNRLWKESREEKRKAELMLLKSQLNPHFLFNTLNGIYALSLEKSPETSKSIVKLSELMRYMVTEIEKDEVALKDEINFLQSYIDLQRLRLGKTVKITFDSSEVNADSKISPLLLIVFVENAFKYGVNTSKVSEIVIQIKNTGNDLYFSVKNQKGNKNTDDATQKGLENVIRRLELIYPQRHTLKINETNETYFVELIIKNLQ